MTRFFTPLGQGCCCALGVSPGRGDDRRDARRRRRPRCGRSRPGTCCSARSSSRVFVLTDSLDGVMARQAGRSGPVGRVPRLDARPVRRRRDLRRARPRGSPRAATTGSPRSSRSPASCSARSCRTRGRAPRGSGMTASGGIAERADRLVARARRHLRSSGVGAPTVVLTVVLALLALASAVTIVQRMSKVYRQAAQVTRVKVDVARPSRSRGRCAGKLPGPVLRGRSSTPPPTSRGCAARGGVQQLERNLARVRPELDARDAAPARPRWACARTCGTSARRSRWRR